MPPTNWDSTMRCSIFSGFLVVLCSITATAQDKSSGNTFAIGEGKLTLTAPANWTKKEPASRIVEAEFAVPPAKGDAAPGRLTAMGAGGSVQSNIDRGVDQFVGPGGAATNPRPD